MNRPAAMMTRDSRHRGYAGDTPFLLRFIDIKLVFLAVCFSCDEVIWAARCTRQSESRPGPAEGP